MKRYLLLINIILCGVLVFSCSKTEEEEVTLKNMEGVVEFDHPSYVGVNEVITMTLKGVVYPSEPSYKWYLPSIVDDTLRTKTVTVKFPDSLAQFSVYVFAEKEGFYQSGTSVYMTTVDTVGERSLRGINKSEKWIFDDRDGQWYQYVTLGNLDWFAQNLAYSGAGVAFDDSPVLHSFFGRFYTWEEATGGVSAEGFAGGPEGVCPEGWTIPTNEDWEDLGKTLSEDENLSFFDDWKGLAAMTSADAYFNDTTRLWAYCVNNDHNNSTGWNALPAGYTQYNHLSHDGFQSYAIWWSSTLLNEKKAFYRFQNKDLSTFPMNYSDKNGIGASIRCVRPTR